MAAPPSRPRRRTPRNPHWDYRTPGPYFVTLNTKDRVRLLSEIRSSQVYLTALGDVVVRCWRSLPEHVRGLHLARFVVMPDHLHGIVILPHDSRSLVDTVGHFKCAVTREALAAGLGFPRPLWQRSFHDRFIRNENEWWRIDRYIAENPARWRE